MASADPTSALAPQREINFTLGPLILGWMFTCTLYGAFIVAYSAYLESPQSRNDSRLLRIVLGLVCGLMTWQAVLNYVMILYRSTQTPTPRNLETWNWLDCLGPLAPAVIGPIVQGYFARRACMLLGHFGYPTAKRVFAAIFVVSILLNSGGSVALAAQGFMQLSGAPNRPTIPTTFYLVSAAWVDILISCSLTWVLCKHVHGFNRKTDTLMKSIVVLGWQTAAYTALLAIVGTVLALVFRQGTYATLKMFCVIVLPGMYCFSMLTNVRARHTIATTSHSSSGSPGESSRSSEGIQRSIHGNIASHSPRPQSRLLETDLRSGPLKSRSHFTVTFAQQEEVELDALPVAVMRPKTYGLPEVNSVHAPFSQWNRARFADFCCC